VLTGRADATINDSLSFLDFKKHKPDADVKIVAQEANADFSGVIVRKGEPELVEAINKALAEIKADGTYKKISDLFRPGRLQVTVIVPRGPSGLCLTAHILYILPG
jgi:cystine transport system substrate-binding protein